MKMRVALVVIGVAALALAALSVFVVAPSIAAGGLLHPVRRPSAAATPPGCAETSFAGDGVTLVGWRCGAADPPRRGTIVYLHGIADNHGSAAGLVGRLRPRGFDVIAYDSGAHGGSSGDRCTYGYYERRDLRRVLATVAPGPVVLIGTSLGAAVALQATPEEPRVAGVVAAEIFSDLRTVATERAPWFLPPFGIRSAFRTAEERGRFVVDAVSPLAAARSIQIPVLLIHGGEDDQTPPEHSRRVYEALGGPKRLKLVPGARHNESLRPQVWSEINDWVDNLVRQP